MSGKERPREGGSSHCALARFLPEELNLGSRNRRGSHNSDEDGAQTYGLFIVGNFPFLTLESSQGVTGEPKGESMEGQPVAR